ncbi:MAG: DUF4968 domain-containing protein, partial [Proteobacteria bacterium]|nr:DUF4968 domain-containing protein [Pseudomonadota bacterium]
MRLLTGTIAAILVFMAFTFYGCRGPKQQQGNNITIERGGLLIKAEIINESIIHITKSRDSVFNSVPDYVTVLKPEKVHWTYEERETRTVITTKNVQVVIDQYGTVRFADKDGLRLLSESQNGTLINPGTAGHSVSQSFESGEEGLYGLGQFQNGIMNWKNVPVRLEQYNQEIAVPFLVSTNNYGIYWHNYSVTDFNRPENEITFSTVVDVEKNIREAFFTPDQTGLYNFFVESPNPDENRFNGPVLLTFNGDTVVHYSTVWVPDCHTGQKHLQAGEQYKVVFQNTDSQLPGRLFYNKPDFNKTVFSSKYGEDINYFFVYGKGPGEVIARYQDLTGSAPMFAKSAYGFWQCRERYHNQEELLENANAYRKRKIPIDNIVQDWFYWPEETKGPEWDRLKYPDPAAMVQELADLN